MGNVITDLNKYILKIEEEVAFQKSKGKKILYLFNVEFPSGGMFESFRQYFSKYIVTIKYCKSCPGNHVADIYIENF